MEWFRNIEVVLFDLDGTLYQDGTFYKRYLELIFGQGQYDVNTDEAVQTVQALLEGGHKSGMGIGDWYHSFTDTWTKAGDVEPIHRDWDGREVAELPQSGTVPAIYAGDAWSLVGIIAAKYRVDGLQRQRAFQQVRKEMLQSASGFGRHHGLYEAIRNLTGVGSKWLLTNSPENTGREFLAALGFDELFTGIIYSADKPNGIERQIQEVMKREGVLPGQILSIGDHAWNDLYPVSRLGGRTVWLSPYPTHDPSVWDMRIAGLDELTRLLVELQQAKREISPHLRRNEA